MQAIVLFSVVFLIVSGSPQNRFPNDVVQRSDPLDYRLPNTTKPIQYLIWISLAIHQGEFGFNGRETILIEAMETTSEIVLHFKDLAIQSAFLFDEARNLIQANVPQLKDHARELIIFTPDEPLVKGQRYQLFLTFSGLLREDSKGFYRTSYVDNDGKTFWLAATNFKPTFARQAFPCYDEPSITSQYTIEIRHGSNVSAISNMPVETKVNEGAGYFVTKFEKTASIASYQIGFVISNLSFEENLSDDDTTLRVYGKPELIAGGNADLALNVARTFLDEFRKHFNVSNILSKMDFVAFPEVLLDTGGFGLATFPEKRLMYNEVNGTTQEFDNVISSVASNIGHQWLGNSHAWWNSFWLYDGLTALYTNYLIAQVYPDDRWLDSYVVNAVQPALKSDAATDVLSMSAYADDPEGILHIFDHSQSGKAASVLRMFEQAFGENIFREATKSFLKAQELRETTSTDFYQALQELIKTTSDHPDVAHIFESWADQPGFPYVTVTRDGDKLTFEQNRFMYEKSSVNGLWWIPITYVVESNTDFADPKPDFWIQRTRSVEITSKQITADEWIIANNQQSGFCRVNYDDQLWKLIIEQLNQEDGFEKINLLSRGQIIDDSFNLARAELVNFKTVFEILNYLEHETDFVPWGTAYQVHVLFNQWLVGSTIYPLYQEFMKKNVQKIFNRLAVIVIENEHRLDRYARNIAIDIACQTQMDSCLTQTAAELQKMLDGAVEIEADVKASIYCNGLRTADETTFEAFYEKMSQSVLEVERNLMIVALGCIQNSEILSKFLKAAFDPQTLLSTVEKSSVLSSLRSTNTASTLAIINFARENYQMIHSLSLMTVCTSTIAKLIPTQSLYEEFVSLLNRFRDEDLISEAEYATSKALGYENVKWQQDNIKSVEDFFKEKEPLTTIAPTTLTSTTVQETTTDGSSTVVVSVVAFMIVAATNLLF